MFSLVSLTTFGFADFFSDADSADLVTGRGLSGSRGHGTRITTDPEDLIITQRMIREIRVP